MSGKTAGQMAYEAFTAVRYAGSLTTDYSSPTVAHKAWEAAGAAVETDQVRLAREDRDQLRKRVLDLAATWDDEHAHGGYADALRECADQLRHAAEPPS